jgi:phosphoribosylanthranilate isomerase
VIAGIRLKFCGLTALVDVEFADRLGADYLGFILYPQSSRYLALSQFRDMASLLPTGRKTVAVVVEPNVAELEAVMAAGFDRVQLHFRLPVTAEIITQWQDVVGRERLWLAPKLPPAEAMPPEVVAGTDTILWDTFHEAGFGGSGLTGDWAKFNAHQQRWPDPTWILAGGLTPDNVGAALTASGARFIDVAGGIEAAPGIKDHAKMKAFVLAVHRARTAPSAE